MQIANTLYDRWAPDIIRECDEIRELLLAKNEAYGNSALQPLRLFSQADPVEQIRVRIDDKLSRIHHRGVFSGDEDTLGDLIGYLILLKVALKQQQCEADGDRRVWG
jgi:hypothetical protein